jgi:phage shock protein A
MADTQKNLAQSIGGMDSSSSFEKLNRMEEKIVRKEAEADAFTEISGSDKGEDNDTFEKLQQNAKVDAELRRLMDEMGGTKTDAAASQQ